ncbi:MAG TPA: hypothetical protein VGD46_12275 [Rhizobacter sp.]
MSLHLFGKALRVRQPDEFADDDSYLTIPALHQLAGVAQTIGNKLTNEARNALFFERNADPELRAVKVELGLQHLEMVRNAQPDPDYFLGAKRPDPHTYVTAGNDEWLPKPDTPAP